MKVVNYFFIILLLAAAASALPPQQAVFENSPTLNIESAHPPIMKFNDRSDELYFHVYNASDYWLNTSQVNCTIHIYNVENGNHLEEMRLGTHSNTEFEYVFNTSKFLKPGEYTYLVYCVGNAGINEAGFLRSDVVLTYSGESITYEAYILAAVFMLLPLVLGWLLLTWVLSLGEEHTILKIGGSLFVTLCGMMSLGITLIVIEKFFSWNQILDIYSTGFWVYGLLFFVLCAYWALYLIRKAFDSAKKAKMERLEY